MLHNGYFLLDTDVSGQPIFPSANIRVYLSLPFCISPELPHVLMPLHPLAPTFHIEQTAVLLLTCHPQAHVVRLPAMYSSLSFL